MLNRLLVSDSHDYSAAVDGSGSALFAKAAGVESCLYRAPVFTAAARTVAHSNFEEANEFFLGRLSSEGYLFDSGATVQLSAPAASIQTLRGLQVLVVDDEEDALELLRVILEAEGVKVTTAISAEAALQSLASYVPDVLISDIGMPQIDGYMLMQQVRLQGGERGLLPAIALSAYAGQEEQSKAFAAGFQIYLSKPVTPNDLIQAVASLRR